MPLSRLGISSASVSGLISWITSSLSRPVAVEALDVGEHHQLLGPERDASAAAAVSALTLCTRPSWSGATLEITGIRPASTRSSTASGRTCATSPTRPRSTSSPSTTVLVGLGGEQAGVLAGEPDGDVAVLVDQPDELALHLADQHHPDDVHRLGRGHPQAALELRLDAELVEHRGDLRATTVHDDGLEAGEAEERDVLGEGLLQVVVDHRVAAVLHHDDLAVVLHQPRQGAGEGLGGVAWSRASRVVAHEEYALFSWT